jgi:hypothetical protein
MHVTDRSKTVVMLIDWDNLQICHSRDAPGTELDLQALIALAQSYGTLVSARAYAEWNLLSERLAVYKAGIEPVFAPVMRPEGSPREGKSLADTVMVADGVDLLWTVAPDVFVLATSDKDMIPLARIAKQRGAAVVVLGSDLTAIPLVEMSNVFITYRQLLRELDRVAELEAPVGRAPARERRLRESRRPSSEPYGGGTGFGSNSGFGGAQIGPGGRGGPRPVGSVSGAIGAPPAPAVPLPAPSGPRRRLHEPIPAPAPAIEADRSLTAQTSTAPAPEAPDEPVGIGAGDVAPRRRRRRGGRGRRSGLGGLGDADSQAETQHDSVSEHGEHDDHDEADDETQGTASASGSSPDDIDNAVLQLLAARDREPAPAATAPEPTRATEQPAATEPVAGTDASPAPAEAAPPPTPRRTVRTSFSSFGPPEIPFRPATPTTEPPAASPAAAGTGSSVTAETAAASTEAPLDAPEASPAAVAAAPATEGASSESTDSTSDSAAAARDDAPEAFGNGVETSGAAGEGPTTIASGRTARSSRSGSGRSSGSGRTGSTSGGRSGTTRRTRASGSGAAVASSEPTATDSTTEAASGSTSGASGEAARGPRRHRSRRPAGAVSEGSTGEPIAASEAASAGETSV